ncbi:MAG: outer membrane receptor protein involved in Fe transport [Alcanivorax sp.]|jgi:outer membrane receptor protein involved in Fe transport
MKGFKTRLMLGMALASGTVAAENRLTEQVLVTATRVNEAALPLPLAWSVVDSEDLEITSQIHINEVMQRVAGTWISRGNGQESLTALRSPVLTGAGGCGAFYMAWDSISLRAPGFCNVNQLFDANSEQAGRIEVIKGPATALYGSNAMHGVINIMTATPSKELDQTLSLEAGPDDYYRGKYQYSNTEGRHGVSLRLNGTTDGGYLDDAGYGQQKFTLRHDYAGDVWALRSAIEASNLNQETAGFIQGFEAYEDNALKDTNPNPEAYRDAWSLRLYSSASRDLGDRNRLTITPYYRNNDMEFLQHFLPWQPVEENGHSSFGLRTTIDTETKNWRWQNGIDLEYTDGWLKQIQADEFSPNQPAGVHYDYQVDATSAALYSQLRSDFSNRWTLMAGARYEYTEFDYDNRTEDGSACGPEASACRFFRPANRSDDFSDWTLNAGISYGFSDAVLGYARLARGFRAPQTTELYRLQSGQQTADLDSEQIDSLEFGLRGQLLPDLSYDLSFYTMNKDEVIFQDANRQNISGAKTRHYGAELSIDYNLTENWYLGLDVSSARHTYDSRIELLGSSGDIKGNDIDTAPRVFGSARLGWDTNALIGQQSRLELEWVYMDKYYLDPDNEHEYEGHSLLNLRLSADINERWQIGLRVTNLLDEDYAERADFGFGSYRYFVGQPMGVYFQTTFALGGD